jgi:hypothetical protein
MLLAGKSHVQFSMSLIFFSINLIHPKALWPLGLTQLLTEISTRNLPGGCEAQSARKITNFALSFKFSLYSYWFVIMGRPL